MNIETFLKEHKLEDSIGAIAQDGKLTFPKMSITGQEFDKTQTRVNIGKRAFVVLDRFLDTSVRDQLLKAYAKHLKVELSPKPIKKATDETA